MCMEILKTYGHTDTDTCIDTNIDIDIGIDMELTPRSCANAWRRHRSRHGSLTCQ